MRWHDDDSFDGETAVALEAIDATLAGEPTDPEYAELAELALILRDERPTPDPGFARLLDGRVQRRFARPADARGTGSRRAGWMRTPRRWLGPGAAIALGACTAVVVVIAAGHGGSSNVQSYAAGTAASSAASSSAAAHPLALAPDARATRRPERAAKSAPYGSIRHGSTNGAFGSSAAASSAASSSTSAAAASGAGPAPTPAPSSNRQIVQSAQLALSTAPGRIDDVAQQVFDVIGNEDGIVDRSSVTATGTPDGGAQFQLRVPSQNLADALTALSRLRGANVLSRTDNTQDITGQVGGAGERLAEARALRRSLLHQLAAATTTEQVDSLKIQLRDANASIASDLSTLRGLKRQVAYSRISLSIQAVVPPTAGHSSGFTIGRGAHDAERVLVVVAGVALIALAVLVPVALVVALLAWFGLALRRRRREQALDAA
ncbi:MAG: DUF4349 domain-containing protein [Solirubrobacteraceae bacterium]